MENMKLTADIISSFRFYLVEEEKSSATIEKYMRDVRMFCGYACDTVLSKELVMSFKNYLIERNYAVNSINSMLASLNSLLDFMGIPECKVKCLKKQRQIYCPEEKELTKEEYFRLLEASRNNPQLQLIMQTICSTGIRVSELQFFTVEAVKAGEVLVNCKGKRRTILIPGKLRKKLLEYSKKNRIKSGAVFINKNKKPLNRSYIWAMMKGICLKAGVRPSKVFPHNLRKLFARSFYGIEKDIAKLADILGHSSIDTTRIYIMSTGYEHLKKIEKLQLVI